MKETVLRILNSTKEKDPIQGLSRRDGVCIFHCAVRHAETLLQEDVNCGEVTSLRIRQLSSPPPEITPKESYKTVTKLELSCPVEVSWVFGVSSILPALNIIRFGSSCFEFPFGDCPPVNQSWLSKCPSVKELIISFDHRKLVQEDFDNKKAIQSINSILEYSTKYFISLAKADLYLPLGAKLEEFLRKNPTLGRTGEIQEIFKHGTNHFQSFAYSDKSKKLPQLLRKDSSSGSEPSTTGSLPLPQLGVKRARSSDTTEFSSEADEDWEDAPPPPPLRIRSYEPRSSPSPVVDPRLANNYRPVATTHYQPAPVIPDYSAAYSRPSRNGDANGHHNGDHQDTPSSQKTCETQYTDFTQMYTRRRAYDF